YILLEQYDQCEKVIQKMLYHTTFSPLLLYLCANLCLEIVYCIKLTHIESGPSGKPITIPEFTEIEWQDSGDWKTQDPHWCHQGSTLDSWWNPFSTSQPAFSELAQSITECQQWIRSS